MLNFKENYYVNERGCHMYRLDARDETGSVVGSLHGWIYNSETAILTRINTETKRTGIGSAMIEKFVVDMQVNGIEEITGIMFPDQPLTNDDLERFYRKNNFEIKEGNFIRRAI